MESLLHVGIILFASVTSGEEHSSGTMQHRLQSRRLRGILCPRKPGQASRKAGPEMSRTIQGNTRALGNRTQAQLVAMNSQPFYSLSGQQRVLLLVFQSEDGVRPESSFHPFLCYPSSTLSSCCIEFWRRNPPRASPTTPTPPLTPGAAIPACVVKSSQCYVAAGRAAQ